MAFLTIGIPTYNRADYLEKILVGIIPVCEEQGIEVLVSDNCSADNTAGVLRKFSPSRCLRYLINTENLGFDRNILNLLDNASGHFLWLLGDDDNINARQIANVVHLLENNPKTALFHLGFRYDFSRAGRQKKKLTFREVDPQQYVDHFLHKATLISTNIINLDYYKKLSINQACISKGWIHLHLLLLLADRLAEEGKKILVVKNQLVIQGTADGQHSVITRWIEVFFNELFFTLDNTPVKHLNLRKFIKGIYDTNIRLKFLNLKDIMNLPDPLDFYRKVVRLFKPGVFGRLTFRLLYVIAGFKSFFYGKR